MRLSGFGFAKWVHSTPAAKKMKVVHSEALYFGGNANNGANAGFGYLNSNNSASNTNANIGFQLGFFKLKY